MSQFADDFWCEPNLCPMHGKREAYTAAFDYIPEDSCTCPIVRVPEKPAESRLSTQERRNRARTLLVSLDNFEAAEPRLAKSERQAMETLRLALLEYVNTGV